MSGTINAIIVSTWGMVQRRQQGRLVEGIPLAAQLSPQGGAHVNELLLKYLAP